MAKMNKMTMKKYEGSKADMKIDKARGYKEGSKADMKADKAAVKKANKK
jgi:hypothetical protein